MLIFFSYFKKTPVAGLRSQYQSVLEATTYRDVNGALDLEIFHQISKVLRSQLFHDTLVKGWECLSQTHRKEISLINLTKIYPFCPQSCLSLLGGKACARETSGCGEM